MKKIVFFLFIFMSYFSYGQKTQPQSFNYTAPQIFSDSVKMNALGGSGLILGITEDGVLIKRAGTSTDTINISQVLGLQDSLALKQAILSFDSNFVFTNNKIDLNDTIWTEVGKFSDEIQVKNTAPNIRITESDASVDEKDWRIRVEGGTLRIRTFGDDGSVGGNNVGFYRTGNVISSLRLTDSSTHKIILKNSGTGIFEDTVRSGQLKVAGILYPLTDGTSGQVLTTNGSGVATFSNVTSPLIAGTNITISGDTISSTGGSDADWTVNGNYVYNLSDSIGIGVSDPDRALEISGQTKMSSSGTSTLEINNSVTGVGVDINSSIGSGISILSNKTFGYGIDLNSYQVDSISNDNTLVGADERALVTEQAVKGYVDNAIENNTRVSWGADVDTSARVNGFVLKWNGATKKHYYDTAGTGGGGGTYFAGAGLELSGTTFSIGNDGVSTAMVQDDAITYSKLQNVGANSVLARTAASSGDISEVSLSANQLLGRGSTGNVDAIGLNGLNMVAKTLTNPFTGTVTNVAIGNGLTGSSITTTGTVTLGTPSTLTGTSANSVTTSSHTHAIDVLSLFDVDNNFNWDGSTLDLNDTIWTGVGNFNEELKVSNEGIIGGTTPIGISSRPFLEVNNGARRGIVIGRSSSDVSGSYLNFVKSRASTYGDRAVVQNGDDLGRVEWNGDDGTSIVAAANIRAIVDGVTGTNDMPTRLQFSTSADGSSTPAVRVTIKNDGDVGIGTTSPNEALDVNGNIITTGGTTNSRGITLGHQNNINASYIGASESGSVLANDRILWDFDDKSFSIKVNSGTSAIQIDSNSVIKFNNEYTLPTLDGTSGQVLTTNGAGSVTFGNISINNSNWSGTDLSVANGGTGVSTLTGVVIGNGASAMTAVSGTANQVLRRNAANTGYEFYTPSAGTGTVTSVAAGGGMTFSTITGSGSVTMGTPEYITGTSTNSVSTNGHTHAIDMTTLGGNIRTFYLDTARVASDFQTAGKIAITNQEKVISFTLTREADSVRLMAGYYTLQGMVDIEVTNDDTTAGVAGFFQNYQLNAFVTDGVQLLGRPLSGTTTVIETAEANATPVSSTDGDGSPKDGTIKLHLTTVPVKFYLESGQFVALTIKATYPSPADFVSHKRATMILTRAIDFDGTKEQTPDIEAP